MVAGPLGSWRVRALLDTGAGRTMIPLDVATRIGLPMEGAATMRIASVTGLAAVPVVRVVEIRSLGVVRRSHEVVVHDLPGDIGFEAILGLDFLRGHRFCIDMDAGVIDIEPAAAA